MSKKENTENDKSDKSDKNDKSDKCTKKIFFQRILAFLIDITLVSLVCSIIVSPFLDSDGIIKLFNSLVEVFSKYNLNEIDYAVYVSEAIPIMFQLAKKYGLITLVGLFISILYFIVFQFKNQGQTIGKKLMKIKVVSIDGQMTMNQMLIRSLIINSILVDMISFALVVFTNEKVYFYGSMFFNEVQSLVFMVSVALIIFSKNGRGIHDLVSRCEVVEDNK